MTTEAGFVRQQGVLFREHSDSGGLDLDFEVRDGGTFVQLANMVRAIGEPSRVDPSEVIGEQDLIGGRVAPRESAPHL